MTYNLNNPHRTNFYMGGDMLKRLAPIILLAAILLASCTKSPQAGNPEAGTKGGEEPVALTAGVQTVSGKVLSGGDTTAEGLQDSPRNFVYQVAMNGGGSVEVAYTAFPPGPAADRQKFKLELYAGQVQVGDYIEIRGTYDPETNRITISEEGDYLKTFEKQP